jgi:lipoate-protein ligase A
MRWRLLATPPLGAADNMACDEVLLRRAADTGEGVLRVYGWREPALSLGRNQPARDEYDRVALAERGISVVRRLTGGRAVLHHRDVTYSVSAPDSFGASLGEAYQRINAILLDGLRALGVDAALAAPRGRAPIPSTAPCFDEPTAGELVLGDRKLVGSAQFRDGGALLQHGSILIDDAQGLVASCLRVPIVSPPAPATLRAALGRVPTLEEVGHCLFDAVRRLEDPSATDLRPDDALRESISAAAERYRDPAWTWRR